MWWFRDGRPGHEHQARGLIAALQALRPLRVVEPPLPRRGWLQWLMGRFPAGDDLPAPDLLIGAGHATHTAMLAARRAVAGKIVVLMRPSLPMSWFDLCVVPEHDQPGVAANVLVSRGVLNAVRAKPDADRQQNMILLGGHSRHHQWDNEMAVEQVEQVLSAAPGERWLVCTSPRSDQALAERLSAQIGGEARVVAPGEVESFWLAEQLSCSKEVWVSEDSASMMYEALTSGAKVGVLPVSRVGTSRVARGLDGLLAAGLVTRFEDWQQGSGLQAPAENFNEADRCARWIEDQWLTDR